jgi:ABC-type phosphate transport system permease subunit
MADIRRVCYRPHERRRKRNSEAVVNTLSQSTEMVEGLRDLLDEQAMPFLKCSFVSEMFADLFIPLCVDVFGGFSLISGANVVSNIALIISFPVGVMATKRLVSTKVMPEATYGDLRDLRRQ